jgi:hypothetical protein
MGKSFQEKLAKFVEAEKMTGVDQDLMTQLHEFLADETLYWDLPPERRNTLNLFFKEIHSMLDGELAAGKYGASIVLDSMIVTIFEVGYRLGIAETESLSETAQAGGLNAKN